MCNIYFFRSDLALVNTVSKAANGQYTELAHPHYYQIHSSKLQQLPAYLPYCTRAMYKILVDGY
jgi:hypothetical protein